MSRRGAFVETNDSYTVGQPIRLEFKLDGRPISAFANVTRTVSEEEAIATGAAPGINVIFYEVNDVTDAILSDIVEEHWSRFLP